MGRLLVGVDWGHKHVQFVAEDEDGELLWKQRCPAKPDGISAAIVRLRELARGEGAAVVEIAIEQKASRLVEAFLGAGFAVWFVRPEQVDLARKLRFSSKAKDDLRDARAMAWMLQSMRDGLIMVEPAKPDQAELRGLTRGRAGVVLDRTAVRNEITGTLRECFPEMLELGKPDTRWFTALWRLVRTPDGARAKSVEEIRTVLKAHRVRKFTAEQVHAILSRGETYRGQGDWTLLVELAFDRLELLEKQIERLEQQIAKQLAVIDQAQGELLLDQQAADPGPKATDVEIVGSLPGVGRTLTAVLIAERLPELLRADRDVARAMTGVAPVLQTTGDRQTKRKGQIVMRRACNAHLRDALHQMVEKGMQTDPWLAERYAVMRARNHTHGRACRQLADCMLTRLRAMLRDRTRYEAPQLLAAAS